jgi:hypothetical protein
MQRNPKFARDKKKKLRYDIVTLTREKEKNTQRATSISFHDTKTKQARLFNSYNKIFKLPASQPLRCSCRSCRKTAIVTHTRMQTNHRRKGFQRRQPSRSRPANSQLETKSDETKAEQKHSERRKTTKTSKGSISPLGIL